MLDSPMLRSRGCEYRRTGGAFESRKPGALAHQGASGRPRNLPGHARARGGGERVAAAGEAAVDLRMELDEPEDGGVDAGANVDGVARGARPVDGERGAGLGEGPYERFCRFRLVECIIRD